MEILLTLLLIFTPFLGAFLLLLFKDKKNIYLEVTSIITSLIELVLIIVTYLVSKNLNPDVAFKNILANGIYFKLDGFHLLYSLVSIFLWFVTIYFSKEYMKHYDHKLRYYFFYLLTLGSVVGVFLSNDLMTTFIFFEIMSFTSYILVLHDEKEETMKAATTYLSVAVISGMILLLGLFFINYDAKTLNFDKLKDYYSNGPTSLGYLGSIFLLLGFGAKAGMYPLHIWLPKAHPVAPAPASALLSGILTKTGVYGIIVTCANITFVNSFAHLVLALGVITMFLGALLGLLSIDLKRTLACSSMSQIGFILVGVSMSMFLSHHGENLLAASGAILHMVNHSLIKLILFVLAGVVAMNIHKLNLNDIRGFGRKKYDLMILFIVAGLGIMGIPLFNGYVSKTLIHESIVEYIHLLPHSFESFYFHFVEVIFLTSGGLTIAYMSKLFICIFIEKNKDPQVNAKYEAMKNYLSLPSKVLLFSAAIIMLAIGIIPSLVATSIANGSLDFFNCHHHLTSEFKFFSLVNLKGALISLLIGIFFFIISRVFLMNKEKEYINIIPKKLDLETLIYIPLLKFIYLIILYISLPLAYLLDALIILMRRTILKERDYEFKESTLAFKIGNIIDKIKGNKNHEYASKTEAFAHAFIVGKDLITTNFSFALLMVIFGLAIVLIAVLI